MKIVVLSASPKNENSVTLQVGKLMEKMSSYSVKDEFDFNFIGSGVYTKELGEKIIAADLVMFCSSLFHFSIPTQTIKFLNAMQEDLGERIKNKPVTYFTTSSQLMDISAHSYMKKKLLRMGVKYIRSLSLLDIAILSEEGREEVGNWYHYVRAVAQGTEEKFKRKESRVAILDATDGNNQKLNAKMEQVQRILKDLEIGEIEVFKLRDYKINDCRACSACYTNHKCIYNDDFDELNRKIYTGTDIIMAFGEIQDGLMGQYHKIWLDRHVRYGLYPMETETIYAYMADLEKSNPDDLLQFKVHAMALDNFNKDYYAGVCNVDDEQAVKDYCQDLVKIYNYELYPQTNFLSRGNYYIFADVAWTIQNLAPINFEYYKKNGAYKIKPVNPYIQPVNNYKEAIHMSEMRLAQYKFMLEEVKEDCSLKTRRRKNSKLNLQNREMQIYDEKKNFFQKLMEKLKGKNQHNKKIK